MMAAFPENAHFQEATVEDVCAALRQIPPGHFAKIEIVELRYSKKQLTKYPKNINVE